MRRAPALLVLLLLLTACGLPLPSGVQSAGDVTDEGEQPQSLTVVPPGPQTGASPEDVVRGFLVAQRSPDDDHAVARQFLAPGTEWEDDQGAVVYRSRRFVNDADVGDPLTFTVRYDTTARVEPTGAFALDDAPVTAAYTVGRLPSGEYRLTSVPRGLHLTPQDRARSFRAYEVYFLGRDADGGASARLVPDRVFLPVSADPAASLVDALLRGATLPLRPSVDSALPAGTGLAAPVAVAGGVVTVDLTGSVRDLDARARQRLSAQLVWTLSPAYSGVRVLVDGEPLDVDGAAEVQTRQDWEEYDPAGVPPAAPLYYVQDRRLRTLGGALPEAVSGLQVDEVAISPADGDLALLSRGAAGAPDELRTGSSDGPFGAALLSRPGLGSLSFGPGDQGLWLLAGGEQPRVCLLPVDGPARPDPCDVSYERPEGAGPLTALRISRDGARAALVFGVGEARRLHVGRVEPVAGSLRIAGVDAVAPSLTGVADVAWETGTELVVLASAPGAAQVVVWSVSVDGSTGPDAVQRPGLPGDAVALAAAVGRPLVVAALLDGRPRLYRDDGTLFRLQEEPGTAPTYPG